MDESGRRTAGRSFFGERKGDTGKLPETWEKRGGDCRIVVKKEGFSEEEWIQMPADLPAGERIRQKTGDSGSVPAGSKTVVLLPGNTIH